MNYHHVDMLAARYVRSPKTRSCRSECYMEANEGMNGKYHPDTLAATVNLAAMCVMTACRALTGTHHS